MLERLAQDFRHAARRLARDRGFTVATRPFAVRSPDRIVMWSDPQVVLREM
jgi:hypothetical protein